MNTRLIVLATALTTFGLAGCNSGSDSSRDRPGAGKSQAATLQVQVLNALGMPLEGVVVTIDIAGSQRQRVTGADGLATYEQMPPGMVAVTASVADYDIYQQIWELGSSDAKWDVYLEATGAWAAGRIIVLGSEVIDLAAAGNSLTFAVDVAVIAGENPQALSTLTASDFELYTFDCGWGGPRGCALDADGNAAKGHGVYSIDGVAKNFALQPAGSRAPYLAGVLAERSGDGSDWDIKGPAMKSFFTTLGGNDAAGLATVQGEGAATTLSIHGPFTTDGTVYLDAIDQFGIPADGPPAIQASLLDAIRWTSEAAQNDFPGREANLVVLSSAWLTLAEIHEASELARQSGVRVSAVAGWTWGVQEVALRTGGFNLQLDRPRQYAMALAILDEVLAGTLPTYRMEFRLTGESGLFTPGGNVKVHMRADVPADVPVHPASTDFDVAIPN